MLLNYQPVMKCSIVKLSISKNFTKLKTLNNHYVDHSNAFHTFIVQGKSVTPILLLMHYCVSSLHQPHLVTHYCVSSLHQPHLFTHYAYAG